MSASALSPFDALLRNERISHAADALALGAKHPHLQDASDSGTLARDALALVCAKTKVATKRDVLMLAALVWEAGGTIEHEEFAANFCAAMRQIVDHIGGTASDVEAARQIHSMLPSSLVPMTRRPRETAETANVFDLLDDGAQLAAQVSDAAGSDPKWAKASETAIGVVADLRKACAFAAPRNSRDVLMQIESAFAVSDYVLPEADKDAAALRAALAHVADFLKASPDDVAAAGRVEWRLLAKTDEPMRIGVTG